MFKARHPQPNQKQQSNHLNNPSSPPSDESPSFSETTTSDGTDTETAPAGKKTRAKRGTGLNAQRQTESLKKIRSTLIMVFSGSAGMLRMLGNITNNEPLIADSHVFSPVNTVTGNTNTSVHELIEAIVKLAEQDKNVRDMLLSLGSGSAYTNVVVAALPMIIAVLANHNLIPNIFKAVPAEALPNAQNG
jgi:hypothetical protein